MTEKLKFAVEDISLLDESNDSQFATLKIDAFSSGNNRHSLYVSEDTLRASAKTILEKPIVWQYDAKKNDAMSHEKDEYAVGFIPKDSSIEFKELEDGRTMMSIVGKLWTRYSGKLMEIFNRDKSKSVSVEIEVLDQKDTSDFGIPQILSYAYSCITILGKMVTPAIEGAKADLVAFAEQEEKEYMNAYNLEFSNKYIDIDFTIPKELKSAAKKSLDTYKEAGESANSVSLAMARFIINNEKITVDKVKAMAKYFNSKTEKTSIAIGFYGGKSAAKWSKGIVDSINSIDEKRLSYFEEGEIVTFPYSKLEDVPENMKKLDGVPLTLEQINKISEVADAIGVDKKKNGYAIAKSQFKKSHVIKDNRWVKKEVKEEMSVKLKKTDANKEAEIKFSLTSSQITEILNNALSEIKYGEDQWRRYWVYNFDPEYVYLHNNEESKDFRAKYSIDGLIAVVDIEGKEEVVEGSPIPVEAKEYVPEFEEEEFAEPDKKDEEPEKDSEGDDKKEPEDPEKKPEEEEKNPKEEKMSLDSNLDMAALLAMLSEETDDYKSLVAKYEAKEEMDYFALCGKMYAKMCKMSDESKAAKEDKDVYMAELDSLREFKAKIEKQQLDYAVEKTLQEVVDVFSKEELDNAREEAKAFDADSITAWQSDIKSKAFSRMKEQPKKKENFTRIATVNSWLTRNNESSEEVSKKYAKEGWLPKN